MTDKKGLKFNCSKMPPTLYKLVTKAISQTVNPNRKLSSEYRKLPNVVLFDIYHQMYHDKKKIVLSHEFSDIDIFDRLIEVHNKNVQLIQIYQYLEYHCDTTKRLILSYVTKCNDVEDSQKHNIENMISSGLRLGNFLNTCGQYAECAEVLSSVKMLCSANPNLKNVELQLLECYHGLFHARTHYCAFQESAQLEELILEIVSKLNAQNIYPNMAQIYSEFSFYYFMKSDYGRALDWSLLSLEQISVNSPVSVVIDVLRQAAVSCVVKRKLKIGKILIEHAVKLMKETYPEVHPKVSDVLLDYGFYFLNSDSNSRSVKAYKMAVNIQNELLIGDNIKLAVANHDLAYALYVKEYNSGNFSKAKELAEGAVDMLTRILPHNHLLIGMAERVTALILEEIALDLPGVRHLPISTNRSVPLDGETKSIKDDLLKRAEEFHKHALLTSQITFGEKNVQVAKHYGNLGRLYQTMENYEKGQAMHLLAIDIKTELLGEDDYEVGLSIGHLASLYNYHMLNFKEAEELHLKSIAISRKLFGGAYSGLQYDYRGLVRIYTATGDVDKCSYYSNLLIQWVFLRQSVVEDLNDHDFQLSDKFDDIPLEQLLKKFASMVSEE